MTAAASSRPRLSSGPRRVTGPGRSSTFWWYLHLSRLATRVMLQAARKEAKMLLDPESWVHLDRAWTEALRRYAESIAEERCREREPEEYAKLASIPERDARGRAVFLSRWFTVPKPGEVGPASWTIDELQELARWVAQSVDENSNAWSWHPDGWRESLQLLREGVER